METTHELAVKYNDRSPMENMHCAKLFEIVGEPEANVFAQVDRDLYKEMRKGIITAILHTDMTKHNDMIKELGLLYQMNSEAFDRFSPADVGMNQSHIQQVMNGLLHCSDINNPMKPWELCQKLAYLCVDEFFLQGDKEKAAGIPVQALNDRDKVNIPNTQVGFIEFVITPMAEAVGQMFPYLDYLAGNLGQNIEKWSELWQKEFSPAADAIDKVNGRVQKVVLRCKAVMRTERMLVDY